MQSFNQTLVALNAVIWHRWVLYALLGVGILFTLWSKFCQLRALTHGTRVLRGVYDDPDDPGAISHFQALSTALSATVGLGNIAGVALAITLGGPGAVFWMWVIGLVGMSLKTFEVVLSMLFRDTRVEGSPRGGPMLVASRGLARLGWPRLGRAVGSLFVVTLLISTVTGGNMFQAWNVADITHAYFGVPQLLTGVVLASLVGLVILGGIQRIGAVAGKLVPFMCGLYLIAALGVVLARADQVPGLLLLIVHEAFHATEASGAFLGGTAGYALLWGMKRALFSSEAGQGSSPIAHCAARTDEPVREGVVAGLEPFIDTLLVCTLTALVLLSTGIWNRAPDLPFGTRPTPVASADGHWSLTRAPIAVPAETPDGAAVFAIVRAGTNPDTGLDLHSITGRIERDASAAFVSFTPVAAPSLELASEGLWLHYRGATLTAKAFDSVHPGLGKWLVTLAAWLFAFSTTISWSFYGETGVDYLFGKRWIVPYKLTYCAFLVLASIPQLIASDTELDHLTTFGTGVMLWVNLPILLFFSRTALRAYRDYFKRMDRPSDHAGRS